MSRNDVIFALATAPSRSALHLQRISGTGAFAALQPLLRFPQSERPVPSTHWISTNSTPHCSYLTITNADSEPIDDVVVTTYRGPHSFTGEDTIEISSHGSMVVLAELQTLFRSVGFRDAEPGEFTLRAFLNGKVDLVQAEAIHELIMSHTLAGARIARSASAGSISNLVHLLRNQVIDLLAYLEAHIDFDESEVGTYDPSSLCERMTSLCTQLQKLEETYGSGLKLREGLRVALVGAPNSGKSSLFNAILGKSRAIVTDIPGTTRDVLEEGVRIANRDFVFLDTAGLRHSEDRVEQIGIRLSHETVADADIVCLLCDLTQKPENLSVEEFVAQTRSSVPSLDGLRFENRRLLLVFSKMDLWNSLPRTSDFRKAAIMSAQGHGAEPVFASRDQIDALTSCLQTTYDELLRGLPKQESAVLISARQRDKVHQARSALEQAAHDAESGDFPEKIASLANTAKDALEELVGEITPEDVLANLFSGFCIGK